MNDMMQTIVPKSDQTNSDDLISGPITVKITGVTIKSGEQPVSVHFDGDNGKPYKPCKSMARIMVAAWGADSKKYVGRSMTLYRDETVKWAGMAVGGIRISHMSDIADDMTMALTVTRSNRKPFTVRPLQNAPAQTVSTAATPSAESVAGATMLSAEQCRNILAYCEQLGVNVSRLLLKLKVASIEEIPAGYYDRCISFIDAASKARGKGEV